MKVYIVMEQYPYEGADIIRIYDNEGDARRHRNDLIDEYKEKEQLKPRHLYVEYEVHDRYER